jgi:hypothetical protein
MDACQVKCTIDDLRKEKMWNYKRASQARLAATNQVAREQLMEVLRPSGSTNTASCSTFYSNKGDKRNFSMLSKECVLTFVS